MAMKNVLAAILISGAVAMIASLMVAQRIGSRYAAQQADLEAKWLAEKAALESALDEAKARSHSSQPTVVAPIPIATPVVKQSPAQIVAELQRVMTSTDQMRAARLMIYHLEILVAAGPDALQAIREFLARNEDIDLAPPRSVKRGVDDFLPSSLRFGLFDVLRLIGGADAEQLMAETLNDTGRGAEVAWLARALQQIVPNKYRETALAAARELLGRPTVPGSATGADRNERELLFGVLTMYGDISYVSLAQAQLVRTDGAVDRSALRYLQQSLGEQAVPIASQMYDDPRLTESAKKEPFARLALNYVGADTQADAFYQKAINDMNLTASHRKNLIEDLNQDGFADTKNLTARDLPLIQNRLALIEELAPHATDPANIAAFKEAYKDLLKMLGRAARPPQAAP
jgi:hypothetical protein